MTSCNLTTNTSEQKQSILTTCYVDDVKYQAQNVSKEFCHVELAAYLLDDSCPSCNLLKSGRQLRQLD